MNGKLRELGSVELKCLVADYAQFEYVAGEIGGGEIVTGMRKMAPGRSRIFDGLNERNEMFFERRIG